MLNLNETGLGALQYRNSSEAVTIFAEVDF
jgi:hypothetical protein